MTTVTTNLPSLRMCFHCGYEMSQLTNALDGIRPKPGDVALCMRCGHLYVVDDRRDIQEPNEADLRRINSDPKGVREIAAVRRAIAIMQARKGGV